jgi:hypothetical protein
MKKSILAVLTLLIMGNMCAHGAGRKALADMEFEFDGKQYSIVYSWEGRIESSWSYLKSDTPPITFKEAKALLEKEIKRAFPEEVFQISELNLNTNSAGYSYYHARLTHMIDGTEYSYTHLNLEVYMDGSVSKIRIVEQ